jgi:hypothetical protein
MRPATKSLREVVYARPLRECGIEELAVHQYTANPSGGVMFARKKLHTEKDHARNKAAKLFKRKYFPKGLSLLTMPGLGWSFERLVLRMREGNWESKKGPHDTYLTCIENDRCIYHAAVMKMPGLHQSESFTSVLSPTAFAERVVRNRWVGRFFFGNVDDLMQQQEIPFDGAWLDYTGPLSIKRLEIIRAFYEKNIRSVLVVTALKARWNIQTSEAIQRAGGHSQWVRSEIKGRLLHDLEYQDVSPMSQLAIAKEII